MTTPNHDDSLPRFPGRPRAVRRGIRRWLRLAPRALGAGTALLVAAGAAIAAPDSVTTTRAIAPAVAAAPAARTPKKTKDVTIEIPADDGAFMRVTGDDTTAVSLEIATRTYERAAGGPSVTLAGVVHIGDHRYYRELQEILARHELVLYESVKPAGTGGAGGDTPEMNVETTREAMRFVARVIEKYRADMNEYPADLEAAREFARQEDARLASFFDIARLDAWGRSLVYEPDGSGPGAAYRLASLGADGRTGGEAFAADIELDEPVVGEGLTLGGDDSIQVQLARALHLAFQLDAVDYGRDNWRCSDMSVDQVRRAMADLGTDFTVVEGQLAGTSLPAQIARFFLGVVRMADLFTSGAVSDMIKVVLIETLGDEAMVQETLRQFDEGFTEVIINQRNAVVIEDLKEILRDEPQTASVAVLYGAGHMKDMQQRLVELGYRPAQVQWHRAIHVDLTRSPMNPAEVRQMRMMVRRTMMQMRRR